MNRSKQASSCRQSLVNSGSQLCSIRGNHDNDDDDDGVDDENDDDDDDENLHSAELVCAALCCALLNVCERVREERTKKQRRRVACVFYLSNRTVRACARLSVRVSELAGLLAASVRQCACARLSEPVRICNAVAQPASSSSSSSPRCLLRSLNSNAASCR